MRPPIRGFTVETENAAPLVTESVAELIAMAAAMAANNGEAFQRHNFRLHKLGVSREDRIKAVNIAVQVKMTPHRDLMDMAEGYLAAGAEEGGCCGGECGGDCAEEACCGGEEGCGCGH
jgi:hypothetical protein